MLTKIRWFCELTEKSDALFWGIITVALFSIFVLPRIIRFIKRRQRE